MVWCSMVILAACIYYAGGTAKTSGIEQFWKGDYKVFEQIYGKTSDRDIYGASLPAAVKQGIFKTEASEKKERFQLGFDRDPNDFGDKFNELLKKATVKPKPATSTFNFIKYDGFKPISESNNPETYKYLQYLEGMDNAHDDISISNGFKPFMNYGDTNPKDTGAYKSIQDILDAHEQNQESKEGQQFSGYGNSKVKKPPRIQNSDNFNRCIPGRCKKRTYLVRSRTRPYVKRTKDRYVKY